MRMMPASLRPNSAVSKGPRHRVDARRLDARRLDAPTSPVVLQRVDDRPQRNGRRIQLPGTDGSGEFALKRRQHP